MTTPAAYCARLAASARALGTADPFAPVRAAAGNAAYSAGIGDLTGAARDVAELLRHLDSVIHDAQTARDELAAALRDVMDDTGLTSFRVPGGTWYLRDATPRVVIHDEAAIPPSLMMQPPPRPDLAAIRAALRAGGTVPGATLGNGGPPALCFRANQGDDA